MPGNPYSLFIADIWGLSAFIKASKQSVPIKVCTCIHVCLIPTCTVNAWVLIINSVWNKTVISTYSTYCGVHIRISDWKCTMSCSYFGGVFLALFHYPPELWHWYTQTYPPPKVPRDFAPLHKFSNNLSVSENLTESHRKPLTSTERSQLLSDHPGNLLADISCTLPY